MLKRTNKSKIVKSLTVAALSTSFILSSLSHVSNVTKADAVSNAETVLAKLTPQQREALQKISTTDQTGLFLNSNVNLNSPETVSVIVSFKQKPQKIAVLESALKGQALSESEAASNANADHTKFKSDISSLFKTKSDGSYKIKREYKHAFNGVALEVPANKLNDLMKSTAVQAIYSDVKVKSELPVEEKDSSTNSTGKGMADERSYLQIDKLHQEGYTGKGVKVAVIDTGVDYNHPDIKAAYKGGYDFVDNDNDPMETTYDDYVKAGKPFGATGAANYVTEHGTHVSGTIVGQGKNESEDATTGIAPDADLYVYRVLGPGGSGSTDNIIAGIDQAVADGVDVMNLSLGADYNDPLIPQSIAINNAVLNGISAVVAAGNAGNKMYTLGSPGTAALGLTVGASSVPITTLGGKGSIDNVTASLLLMAKGAGDDVSKLKGATNSVVDVNLGEAYSGKDVKGKIVLMSRGTYTLDSKIAVAKSQGAVAVLMYNDNPTEGQIPTFLGDGVNFIPTFSLSNSDGLALKQKLQSGSVNFTFTDIGEAKTQGDTLADFSSRGPARLTYDIKPEITAPGVSVLSTVPSFINNPDNPTDYKNAYQRLSGTSMATPFTTGVVALLKQANPNLQTEDIKAILMNTADSLSKQYSVFEQGAGRIDPYHAIHSTIEIKVQEKTPMILYGREKQINEETGALSFGNVPFNGKDYSDNRSITLMNRGEKSKTFDVKVNYQSNLRGSKDAAANGVTVQTPSTVTLKGNSQKKTAITLNIPNTAEKGIYEGYVVYTNKDDPSESYRIPFGVHFVEQGFNYFKLYKQSVPESLIQSSQRWNRMNVGYIALKSHMRSIDVVISDPKTGKDLGVINSYDGVAFNEGVDIPLYVYMGYYYPFTNDPNNPIDTNREHVVFPKAGQYVLKMIGTDDNGNQYTISQDLFVDGTKPKWNINVEGEVPGKQIVEYKDGQDTLGVTAQITDDNVEVKRAAGISADQSQNQIYYTYNAWLPNGNMTLDKDGKTSDEIAMLPKQQVLSVKFEGMDEATNGYLQKQYYFVNEHTPYVSVEANKPTKFSRALVKPGETFTMTLNANNVSKLAKANYKFSDTPGTKITKISLNPAAQKLGGTLDVKQTSSGDTTSSDVTVNFNGTSGVDGDLPMVDLTIEIPKQLNPKNAYSFSSFNFTSQFTDKNNVSTNVFSNVSPITILNNITELQGYIKAQGFLDEKGNYDYLKDYSNISATLTVIDKNGKVVKSNLVAKNGLFDITGIDPSKDDYTLIQDIPGHFTNRNSRINCYFGIDDEVYGTFFTVGIESATAGDVNKDDVIDIKDALAIQKDWGTNERSADINFDGKVDAKDLAFVEMNYLMKNPWVPSPPKPVKNYKGSTLESIKSQLELQ
ncbi:S8 family serine peptidase [Gottfriedia acidiceleris]|uniref:S8 family serine peptidase n=1 Tax=Gottfriedia acidiceleris TaxID=371036 RepID=A0ABY4JJW6_9BACI|nr:S8 family serine peptidase [Gottfriedia acidiceleris]UPM53767.1 S8 family serine peptidase [Gottfriedia acidiceleris]